MRERSKDGGGGGAWVRERPRGRGQVGEGAAQGERRSTSSTVPRRPLTVTH